MAPHDPPDLSEVGPPEPPEFHLCTRSVDLHPYAIGNVEPADIYCLALLHFKNTIAPDSTLFNTWPPTDDDQQWYCLAILRELLPDGDDDYRSLANSLTDTPRLAREAGIDPQDPPHDDATDRSDRYTDTVRDNALWAWPYTPDYVTDQLSWDTSEEIFLEIPEHEVRVSSYRFIDMVSKNGRDLTIPVEKYDEALTFTVDQLRTAAREHGRPCSPSDLLL